ncbi:nuclear cap-binding protein subunit 1 [Trichoderma asperellum]|uniref:Nuclear cap-binding protein subunit 1 n=1 Tax=Trichoderma asperellum TaxID=101201 RepID=A0A6V8QSK2_TRIAP|nr:MIF4G like-domain-containing protein [Trichoderma asperelloides]GFP55319.1 nuclear cap-binding protein subunit 1 [Trichoderma asperellum]
MADYDRRQQGSYNRKRRYRDDDDHYDRRQQRRRIDSAPPPVRLRRQLLSIADSPLRRWGEEVQSIARLVADNYDDENLRNTFVNLAMQLVVEQPLKTPFVAAVVLVANTLKPEIVDAILTLATQETESKIAKGEWKHVKLYLKFLACLQPCLQGDGIFPLLEELFNRAADLQTASSEDTIGTEIVKIILLTIPYIMAAAPGQFQQKAADLMDKTDIIASEPHALQALVDPYHPDIKNEGSSASLSLCMLLQKQLQAEAAKNWELTCIPRPWNMPLEEIESQDKLANAPKHELPKISIPTRVIAGPRPLFPEVYFSVYSDQDVESVPSTDSVASSLIRDGLTDTINGLHFNRNATARYLIDLDCYFADDTFVKRATPFDELRNATPGKPTWKPEDVAVDIVFAQLFQLPSPEHKLVYYHSVLTEACKLAPAAIAPSLGRAIRYLYNNSPRMDLQLSFRFLDWFSHHLSNFGFTWKWAEWSDDCNLPDIHPIKWFLKGALDKEVRLSFAQRIQKTLPEPYQPLVGPEKEKDVPDFKFDNPDTPFSSEGQEISSLLKRKAPDEEFQPIIDKIQSDASERALDPVVASTDVLMTAICWVGSKSLSHVIACIDRSKNRLLDAANSSPAAQNQILVAVMAYWYAHPGIALSIVEKLVNYSILTPSSIVRWALTTNPVTDGAIAGESLAQPHIFELVLNTVTKVSSKTRQTLSSPDTDEETRKIEAKAIGDLFSTLNDLLVSWASGSKDEVMETGDGSSEREATIRQWGQRWLRVFKRLGAIEEAFLVEAAKEKPSSSNGGVDAV